MSMLDSMDDALLGVDDDEELDYDLEKEEEDALLADDPDIYDDENYEDISDDMDANQTIHEEESEVLEIDVNVALDETEEDLGDQNESKEQNIDSKLENDDPSDQEEEQQKERGRFTNERNNVMHRTLSNEIPDSLDKINVQQFNNNNQRNGNNKFQRNNNNKNRFKNRPNNNRGSVFGRMGILPMPPEDKNSGKTVLINPHFRGNVQVNENARLVWDAAQGAYPTPNQQRYPNPQMAQVAPFQSQFPQPNQQAPSPWINPPYHHEQAHNYQALPPGPGSHENIYNNPPHFNQSQGNFNNRDGRFNNPNTTMPPPLMSHPPPHFSQHTHPPPPLFPNRSFYHESLPRRQFSPQTNSPNNNNFDPSYSQTPNHAHHQMNNQNFNQQPPPYVQPPQQQQQQTYESGNDQHFINQNHQGYSNQYGGTIPFQNPQPQQNFQSPTNLTQNQSNFDGFNSRPNQNQFQPQLQVQFNNNRALNNNSSINNRVKIHHHHHQQQQSINRPPPNFNQRTPPKRRPFENNKNQVELRELPKKKKRSLELSNLHEVPTVDMPDTTTVEDKPESEDEETKAYRLKIEEQKILRQKILREKEERRKLAAAQKEAEEKLAASDSLLLTTLKTKPAAVQQQQQQFKIQPTNAPGQAITPRITSQTHQLNIHNQIRNIQNKANRGKVQNQVRLVQQVKNGPRFNQNLAGKIINQGQQTQVRNQTQMQSNQAQINQNLPQPIRLVQNQQNLQVQQRRMVQSQGNVTRIYKQKQKQQQQHTRIQQQANIIITQKVTPELQPQRIVVFNQQPPAQQQQQQQLQSAQQNNRRVVLKSNGSAVDGAMLPETPVVVVSNLAAATTEPKIRKLCQGLGLVQNIEMIPNSRQATIRFKNVQSAHNFFKKYQRKIIDLSMIQVVLGQAMV